MAVQATSSFDGMLRDMASSMVADFNRGGWLHDMISRDLEEKRRQDEEWLASLSSHERVVELTKRRIRRLEARFRAVMDFRRKDDYGW